MKITYRQALAADIDLLFILDKAIFNRDYHLKISRREQMEKFYRNNKIIIISDSGKPIGYYAYNYPELDTVELSGLGLLESHQNRGLGTKVIGKFIREIKKKAKTVFIKTHPHNSGAIRLYLKLGFKITGWREAAQADGITRIFLEKSL